MKPARGQAQGQRAGLFERLFGVCHKEPSAWSAPLHATSTGARGEQAASDGRQLRFPEGGASYASVSAAPHKPTGPIKPTAKSSDPSEPTAYSEMAPGRMSNDVSGPMSGMPVGTTSAHLANPWLLAGKRPNKAPFLLLDLTTPGLSWRGCGHPAQAI